MIFNDYRAYRQIMRPVLELDRDRNKPGMKPKTLLFASILCVLSVTLMALVVKGICLLIVAMPHAWLCVR